jgi:hypothetical protein
VVLAVLGAACGGSLGPASDAEPSCDVVGKGPATLCNVECNNRCGCGACTPGERDGIYTCTAGHCFDLIE